MIEMRVSSILFEPKDQSHLLCLVDLDQKVLLPIAIGPFEARAISAKLLNERLPRPITYDLLKYILDSLDAKVLRVVVSDLREGTFYAQVIIESSDGIVMEIDSRPSDAIALSLRVGAPIYVDESVLEEVGMECPPHLMQHEGESSEDFDGEEGIEGMEEDEGQSFLRGLSVGQGTPAGGDDKVSQLKERLDTAIQLEEYEEAARIRDELRQLEEHR